MQKKPTDELDALLKDIKPDQLEQYYRENRPYLADDKKEFYYYMREILDKRSFKLKDIYSFAGVSESYGGQVMRMEKHTADRDLILRFCIAGHFNWDETNRALKLYGFSELYSKDPRDACIIVAINNRIFDLGELDKRLSGYGLKTITPEEQ